MKKVLAIILSLVLVFALVACASNSDETTTAADSSSAEGTSAAAESLEGKDLKIGIIQYVSHPSLDNCTTGIKNALKKAGVKDDAIDVQIGSDSTTAADSSSAEGTSAAAESLEGKDLKIGIIQYVSHPSLDNCTTGIKNALKKAGVKDDAIDVQIGSDSAPDSDCASFAAKYVAEKYDVIFAVATPAATAAYAATEGTEIPVIFSAVSDPVAAKLVDSNDAPGGLCTGTSDVLDFDAQVGLIKAMQPDVKTIGVIYTSSEANSISQLKSFTEVCEKNGITVESTAIQNDADIPSAASSICAKVDCLNNFTDNKVVNNLSVVLEAANEAGIPVYGSEEEQVKNGCLASVSIDYVALGEVTGEMAVEVLNGADASAMAVKTISDATPVVNTDVLSALNIEMPADFADATTVTTNK